MTTLTGKSPDSDTTTHGVRVRAAAQFLADQSDPDRDSYFYIYRITLSNEGDQRMRLLSRHWIILDGNGNRHEVKGAGVVGEHPTLEPGEQFEYMSSCPLPTAWGTMEGQYSFETADGEQIGVAIGRFFLVPSALELSAR